MNKLFNAHSANENTNQADERAAFAKKKHPAENSPIVRVIKRISDYRFLISCAALATAGAIVMTTVLAGSDSAGAAQSMERNLSANVCETPDRHGEESAASSTQAPYGLQAPNTELNSVLERELPIIVNMSAVVGENAPKPVLMPAITQEPYIEVLTEVPNITPGIHYTGLGVIVRYGEHNALVPAVQERLMILWYLDQDEPTDYLGRVTKAALEAFQRCNDIPVTGELNARTYNALFSSSARSYICTLGDCGSDVEAIEERLYELGFLDKKSGVFDDETLAALKAFQEINGLDADGKVSKNTKETLYSREARPCELEYGDSGEIVLKYQQRLQELGYLTTEPDGDYGEDTKMAVMRFQAQNGLVVDGFLGPTTREKLESENASGNMLSYSMHGSDVMNVQTRLHELNYLNARDVSGYYTSVTELAVKLFQQNNGLKVDGKVGKFTMNTLMSEDAVRAISPVALSAQRIPQNEQQPKTDSEGRNDNSSGNSIGNSSGNSTDNSNSSGSNGSSGNSESGDNGRINNFISVARSKIGCPYVRGGKGPSVFDCSGFVYWCMNNAGISQSYMTSDMWRRCTRYPRNNDINKVRKGDVIVYGGHVAICSGKWTQIDASNSNGKIVERNFNNSYWHSNFICSFRIFN